VSRRRGPAGNAVDAGLVEVALPIPVPRTFLYRAPRPVAPGTRVLVPFGRQRLVGWAVGSPGAARAMPSRIRSVREVLDPEPSVSRELLELARWTADYYLASLGQVLRAALPAGLGSAARPDPTVTTRRVLRLVGDPPGLMRRAELFGRARRQRELYEWLESTGRAADVTTIRDAGYSPSVLDGLVGRGLARVEEEARPRDPFEGLEEAVPRFAPTSDQRAAIAALVAASADSGAPPLPFLLRGVTGSGKTLVYIELLRHVVQERGRGAIVLVPEIALTPQAVARFRGAFGDRVAVLHSALSDGERFDAWSALRDGEKRIAVGARSAIFAPVPELGAIIVDEEHEGSYKQSETPRYHAREVAIIRARAASAVCVLGSATPSLESWHNARSGKFRLLELPARVLELPLPPVRTIDLRVQAERGAGGGSGGAQETPGGRRPAGGILSAPLVEALGVRLERGEQSILLLNRRGYATFIQCRGCGDVLHCPRCNVSLTFHRGRRRLVCHYCTHSERPPSACARCGSEVVRYRGYGTEQVERAVYETFPEARIARMDVDTTGEKWAHHRILDRVRRRDVDILLGTQMIAKGLDFPNVTLVGVVNADVGLNLPDFRAAERTFQLLTQVAGRAGRGPAGGEVLIQTAHPGHYAIGAALGHDYDAFVARELEERRGPGYPPHGRLTNVVVTGSDESAVQERTSEIAREIDGRLAQLRASSVEILGPAPCPIDRLRDRWRWHVLLRSAEAGPLGRVSRWLFETHADRVGGGDLRMSLDRDPLALL